MGVQLIFQSEHKAASLVLTCQLTWTERHVQTHATTTWYKCMYTCALVHLSEIRTHSFTHIHRASPCCLVRLMPLVCVPVGSWNRQGTCLDTSLMLDFIGRKGRLGSLRSTVNGSAYQISLSSTSLATILASFLLMLKQQGASELELSLRSLLSIKL